ncbi:hypothetical protein [Blastococcus sp. SYSU D00820]
MEPGTSVGIRLAGLCLDAQGRLTPQLLAAAAVRCGLVVDLVAEGRLRPTDDSIELDETPTGVAPVDRLALAMAAEPDRPLDSWFAERRLGLPQVAAELVATGTWSVRRRLLRGPRYAVADPGRRERDLRLDVDAPDPASDPADAAVAALGAIAGLVGEGRRLGLRVAAPEVPDALVTATGRAAWVVRAAVDSLRVARARYLDSASVLGVGGVG